VVQLELNDQALLVDVEGRSDSPVGDQGPLLVTFPDAWLRNGVNRLQVAVALTPDSVDADDVPTEKALGPVYLGPVAEIRAAYQFRHAWGISGVAVAIGSMLFMTLLCFAIPWAPADRPGARVLGGLLAVWSAYAALFLGADGAFDYPLRFSLYGLLQLALFASFARFATHWGDAVQANRPRGRPLLGLALLGVAVGFLALLALEELRIAKLLLHAAVLLAVPLCIARLEATARRRRSERLLERVPAHVGLLCCGVDAASALFPSGLGFAPLSAYAPVGGLVTSLSLVVALTLRMADARRSESTRRAELDQLLAQKEREIAAAYERERVQREQQTRAEERQRIMEDMHDGLGNQLVGLLLETRAEALDRERLVAGLERTLDDLRLMVDSLDQVGDSLELALGLFRSRIEPRCQAAGVFLDWQLEDLPPAAPLHPRHVLQIYRILQEAFVNAIRHGSARNIRIALRQVEGAIELVHHDDGCGFEPTQVTRRGLAHMERRARSIGAGFSVVSASDGTEVKLALPQRALIDHACE